jgi:hypothetical protein
LHGCNNDWLLVLTFFNANIGISYKLLLIIEINNHQYLNIEFHKNMTVKMFLYLEAVLGVPVLLVPPAVYSESDSAVCEVDMLLFTGAITCGNELHVNNCIYIPTTLRRTSSTSESAPLVSFGCSSWRVLILKASLPPTGFGDAVTYNC